MSEPKREPDTPILSFRAVAVLAVAGLAWTVCGLAFAVLARRGVLPQMVYADHVEHAVAFYIAALLAAAGLTRVSVRLQGLCMVCVALALWGLRLLIPLQRPDGWVDFLCDVAGACAALAPLALSRRHQRNAKGPERSPGP